MKDLRPTQATTITKAKRTHTQQPIHNNSPAPQNPLLLSRDSGVSFDDLKARIPRFEIVSVNNEFNTYKSTNFGDMICDG